MIYSDALLNHCTLCSFGHLTLYIYHLRGVWEGTFVSYSVFRRGNSVLALLWLLTNTDKGSCGQLTFCKVMPNQLQNSDMEHSSSASQLPNTPEFFSSTVCSWARTPVGYKISHLRILIFCPSFLLIFPSLTTYTCFPNANTFFVRSVWLMAETPPASNCYLCYD